MSSNKNREQIKIDKSAVISYDKTDPRYHLNIEDSDEYTKNIYPLHFKKRCHDSQAFDDLVEYDFPLISRCWGEGYENCAVLQKYGKTCQTGEKPIIETGHCACSRCAMSLYDTIGDTIGYARVDLSPDLDTDSDSTLDRADFKKQNESSAYDRTRVMTNDNIHIDKTPDLKRCGTSQSVNKAGNGLEYNIELDDRYKDHKPIENFDMSTIGSGITSTAGSALETSWGSCLGLCGLDRYISADLALLITLICIILLCICSYLTFQQISPIGMPIQLIGVYCLIIYVLLYSGSSMWTN